MTEAKQGLVQSATADAAAAGDHRGGEVAAAALERADDLFNDFADLCDGIDAGEVMYAIGMMIAYGIKEYAADKSVDLTMSKLREIVECELSKARSTVA